MRTQPNPNGRFLANKLFSGTIQEHPEDHNELGGALQLGVLR
jgi:hypothetical protein